MMNKYNYNLDIFYQETDISYYLLGVIMTDGCVVIDGYKKKVSIVSKDKDWIESIRDLICPEKPINLNGSAWVLMVHSTKLANWLINKGCIPAKSLVLKFPKVPNKYLPDFIRGCIDGDGSLGIYSSLRKKSNKIETKLKSYLCGSSYDFLFSFHRILNKRGINNSFYKKRPSINATINGRIINSTNDQYRVEMSSKATKQLINWIYYPNHRISMPRKYKIAQSIINYTKNHH